jgi:hypothetical protein
LFILNASAIEGYGIEGNVGLNFKENSEDYFPSIDGRIYLKKNISASIGIGLFNSGFKKEWSDETATTTNFTSYRLSCNSTKPTLNIGFRLGLPIVEISDHMLSVFAEPKLIYMPFNTRNFDLYSFEVERKTNPVTGEITYEESEDPDYYILEGTSGQSLFYTISTGISIDLKDNFELSLGYSFSNIDLFKNHRQSSINSIQLNDHLPVKKLSFPIIGIRVNYFL